MARLCVACVSILQKEIYIQPEWLFLKENRIHLNRYALVHILLKCAFLFQKHFPSPLLFQVSALHKGKYLVSHAILFQFSLNGISLGKRMLIWTVLSGDNQKEIGKKYVHKSEFNKQPLVLSVSSVDAVGCRDPCCTQCQRMRTAKCEGKNGKAIKQNTSFSDSDCGHTST